MAEVSTAQDIGAYQSGNAAIAGGAASNEIGYAPVNIDYSPLQAYALAKYKTNLINYKTKEKDRAKVEEMFKDPNINVPLDEHLAEQVRPKLEEFKNEMAKNPSAYSDPKSWYKIQQLDRELLADNAKLKTVQVAKDHYNQLAGAEPDEFKKKNYQDYVAKLEKYKLGEEVPVYQDHFVFDEKHLPDLKTEDAVTTRINGDKVQTVKRTVYNGIDAMDKAVAQHLTDGAVNNTGKDLADALLTHGGIDNLNKQMAQAYNQQLDLNFGLLHNKYAKEFESYKKNNPDKDFSDFIIATNRQGEVSRIGEKLSFLKPKKINGEYGLDYINDNGKDHPDLGDAFTYDKNGVRLNVNNDQLRAIYSVLRNPVGAKEEIIKEELSKTPSEIEKIKAETGASKALTNLRGEQAKTQKSIQAKNYAIHKKITQTLTDLPESQLVEFGREALPSVITKKDGSKESQFLIKNKAIPETLKRVAGLYIEPLKGKPTDEEKTAYEKQKAEMESGSSQMRFYDSNGNDVTVAALANINGTAKDKNGKTLPKANLIDLLRGVKKSGIIVKFMDKNGKIFGTKESMDLETQKQNNKINSKGDAPLGEDLKTDNTDTE